MKGDGHGRGQGPGGGGPDDGVNLAAGQLGGDCGWVRSEFVAHVDRGAGVHFVLDLGLGQGRTVMNTPVNRLEASVDEAFFKEAVKRLKRAGLVVAGHSLVGLVPAAKAADALKLRS